MIGEHLVLRKRKERNFPDGPVVMTLPSNTGGCRINPWSGTYDPPGQETRTKQYCNKFNKYFFFFFNIY